MKPFLDAAAVARKHPGQVVHLGGGWTLLASTCVRRGANATTLYTLRAPGGASVDFDRFGVKPFARAWRDGLLKVRLLEGGRSVIELGG